MKKIKAYDFYVVREVFEKLNKMLLPPSLALTVCDFIDSLNSELQIISNALNKVSNNEEKTEILNTLRDYTGVLLPVNFLEKLEKIEFTITTTQVRVIRDSFLEDFDENEQILKEGGEEYD